MAGVVLPLRSGPSGVVRESLLANCPLRISLRVTDATDSRALLGTDAAALLPGGAGSRGRALVRGASDSSPRRVRIALSTAADAVRVSALADGPPPRRIWLPAKRPTLVPACRLSPPCS